VEFLRAGPSFPKIKMTAMTMTRGSEYWIICRRSSDPRSERSSKQPIRSSSNSDSREQQRSSRPSFYQEDGQPKLIYSSRQPLSPTTRTSNSIEQRPDLPKPELQKIFADNDGGLPFTNILDRGYRSTRVAWRQGQFVAQPTFAKSDNKFSTRDVLRAASSVAADRSGNERAVRVSKMFAYVKRGTAQHKNMVRLCDALAWSFQANFMFEPIL
jgi:hypothetical protein